MLKPGFPMLLLFVTATLCSQTPVFIKQWDKRLGGTEIDWLHSFEQTTDGGYILGGHTNSNIGGDKTESSRGRYDYWIVKIDSLGNKEWDKRFGGSADEGMHKLRQTKDAGYIIGGYSDSGISGDKTEIARGGGDYWIVKTDVLGNKQWDKTYGGSFYENPWALEQATDGGYIVGGYSNSGVSGDKTQENWDSTHFNDDGWVVKVDSLGNKQWDKRFGGVGQDGLRSLSQTTDGGYIMGFYSASGISGDKTQPALGGGDFWIVKIDSLGNKEWDKSYGDSGTDNLRSIQQTADKGFILGGNYFLMIKIDSAGNVQWEKAYSGNAELSSLEITSDKGYLLYGLSLPYLVQPRDKTEPNLGSPRMWVVKTDSFGVKEWDKTIYSDGGNFCRAIETSDGCYAIAHSVVKMGDYVSEPNRDTSDLTNDYWIMKFCWEIPNNAISLDTESGISIYPNPFTSDIAISLQKENLKEATFTISNMLGQVVFQKDENNLAASYTKMLDLSYLPGGVYMVEVDVDGARTVKKVVKE